MASVWEANPTLVERLTVLHGEGLSCSQIARALGNGISRNSVIGKLHRMGVFPHSQTMKHRNPAARNPKPITIEAIEPANLVEPEPLTDGDGKPITVVNVKNGHCRWIHGEVGHENFRYCGAKKFRGSYCEFHSVRTYEPKHPPNKDDAA